MGAITKQETIKGNTLKEAFFNLQEKDREDLGNDIYSGGWNNASGVKEVNSKDFEKLSENLSKHQACIARCIKKPVENKNKIKTVVTNFPVKGARKWVTKYVGLNYYGQEVVNEKTQSEAIKKARKWVEDNPSESLNVEIKKELLGETKVAKINYKPSINESPGVWEVYGVLSY